MRDPGILGLQDQLRHIDQIRELHHAAFMMIVHGAVQQAADDPFQAAGDRSFVMIEIGEVIVVVATAFDLGVKLLRVPEIIGVETHARAQDGVREGGTVLADGCRSTRGQIENIGVVVEGLPGIRIGGELGERRRGQQRSHQRANDCEAIPDRHVAHPLRY
jgi:hypothetical protein